jgi:ATP-binding cassette, subfamily B, multidrug efflux pump
MKTFQRVFPILKKNALPIIAGLLLLMVVDVVQLYIPKVLQIAIDKMSEPGFRQSGLVKYALLIVLLSLSMALFRRLWRLTLIGSSLRLSRDLRQMYYDHLISLSQNFYNHSHTGDLMAYAINDLNAVRMLFGFGFVILVEIGFFSIVTFMFMTDINPQLTLMAVIPLPILTFVITIFGQKIHHRFRHVQHIFAQMSGRVQESISGIRVIKAFGQEDTEREKISQVSLDYVKNNIALVKLSAIFHPSFSFIIGISMGIVIIFGGIKVIQGEITIGEFVAFSTYLGMFAWPVMAIGMAINLYQRGKASMNRLNAIFDIDPEIKDDERTDNNLSSITGDISIRKLSFSYLPGSSLVLKNINLELHKGETLAIVGRTGCGKTSLIDLITRIYEAPDNTIFIGGKEIHQIPLKLLRKTIITVPQDIFLFSDTVANNIRLGKLDASDSEVEHVAKLAQVHDEIMDFDKGYQTEVGERGVTLSGGQKQRIAIARAILSDAEILVFDDSLSAVDTKTERQLLQNLIEVRKGKTTVIIAHRISSLQHADKIIVLDNGAIAETGDHQSLLKNKKTYFNLWEKQQLEEKLKSRN